MVAEILFRIQKPGQSSKIAVLMSTVNPSDSISLAANPYVFGTS